MTYFVLVFNGLVALVGCIILISPAMVYDLLRKYQNRQGLYIVAILIRVILGAAMLVVAPASKFPLTLQVLGWLALAAALLFAAMGRSRFDDLISWAIALSLRLGRLSGLFALLFGGFIVYAVL